MMFLSSMTRTSVNRTRGCMQYVADKAISPESNDVTLKSHFGISVITAAGTASLS